MIFWFIELKIAALLPHKQIAALFPQDQPNNSRLCFRRHSRENLFVELKNDNGQRKRILIAQQSDLGKYKLLLDISQRANRAYARKWGYDYVAFCGLALDGYRNYHATFNKVEVVRAALEDGSYDAVLLLDSDAFVFDLEQDVALELDDSVTMVAGGNGPHDVEFNSGVFLLNLRHEYTPWLYKMWHRTSRVSINLDLQSISEQLFGDQAFLNVLVLSLFPSGGKKILNTADGSLSLIQHVMRPSQHVWGDPAEDRMVTLTRLVNQTCAESRGACDGIPATVAEIDGGPSMPNSRTVFETV